MAPGIQDCDCGIIDAQDPTKSVFTSLFVVNFTAASSKDLDQLFVTANYRVDQTDAPYVRDFTEDQVELTDAGLELTVSPVRSGSREIPCAQVLTKGRSFFYGSYRARFLVGDVPGTVTAFYNYYNDSSEVDVEYLSAWQNPTLLYTVKPQIYTDRGNPDNRTYQQGVWYDPRDSFINDFHDWNFVWLPDIVHYGIDGDFSSNLTVNVPHAPGRIALNHWSNGDSRYSMGPPTENSTNTLSFLQAIYNDTNADTLQCKKSSSPCIIADEILRTGDGGDDGDMGTQFVTATGSATLSGGNTISTLPAVGHINAGTHLAPIPSFWLLLLFLYFMV